VDQLGAKSDFIDGCCAPATSGRVFLFQQGLAIDEMGFGGQLHGSNLEPLNVRFGSKADIRRRLNDIRFTPKSGHRRARSKIMTRAS